MPSFPLPAWLAVDAVAGDSASDGQPDWLARWYALGAAGPAQDGALAALFDELHRWRAVPPEDWRVALAVHWEDLRCRYFLYLLWSGDSGVGLKSRAKLDALDPLPEAIQADFQRWYAQAEADEAALAASAHIHDLPSFAQAMHYRGVDLRDALDYHWLPDLLDALGAFHFPSSPTPLPAGAEHHISPPGGSGWPAGPDEAVLTTRQTDGSRG